MPQQSGTQDNYQMANGRTYSVGMLDKGMTHEPGGTEQKAWDSTILHRTALFKRYKLFISVIFHLIFLDHRLLEWMKAKPHIRETTIIWGLVAIEWLHAVDNQWKFKHLGEGWRHTKSNKSTHGYISIEGVYLFIQCNNNFEIAPNGKNKTRHFLYSRTNECIVIPVSVQLNEHILVVP